jgi:hypothetical protein
MICPECGSYQPDRARYCGICGAVLSQDELVESFLGSESEQEIILPRHRSFWFYLSIVGLIVLSLAIFAGAGYIVYRIAWGEEDTDKDNGEVVDTTRDYSDPELGFSISYPDTWTVEQGVPAEGEIAALTIELTSQKNVELSVIQLDPVISIGGIDAIEEHLVEDAGERILAVGGRPDSGETQAPRETQPDSGETQAPTVSPPDSGQQDQPVPTSGEYMATETDETMDGEMFDSTSVSGLPAFYTEFNANFMGEETRFLLYYIVAGDYTYIFQGRAPSSEFKDVRPQFFSITGSFRWQESGAEQTPEGMTDIGRAPVITFYCNGVSC